MKLEDLYRIIVKFQKDMNSFRDKTNETLAQHSHALISIEDTINIYGDMYKLNKDNIKTLNERVTVLENRV